MYKIRPYTKPDGKIVYELYDESSGIALARDASYMKLREIKKQIERKAA